MSEDKKAFLKDIAATTCRTLCVPIHPAGWPFIAGAAAIAVLLAMFEPVLGLIGLIFAGMILYFFRNPARVVPIGEGLIVAPADGIVSAIAEGSEWPDELGLDKATTRISIFLSVFDIHVNRVPLAGKVAEIHHRPGEYQNAASESASRLNERSVTLLEIEGGRHLAFAQIAGFVARRIVNTLSVGQQVETGAPMGIIRFGSRADIYLPEGVTPQVAVGQRMIGGETVIANLHENGPPRLGKKL